MPISGEHWAVDTSVAVPTIDTSHPMHEACFTAVGAHRPALAGHALFETFSVITRMPQPLSLSAASAVRVIRHNFPRLLSLPDDVTLDLLDRLAVSSITGGGVYDALVGEAARHHGVTLLTRDLRARRTYDLLGVAYELVT